MEYFFKLEPLYLPAKTAKKGITMFNVKIEKECGCFKRSGMHTMKTFDNKDDALIEAQDWAEEMNDTFCKKHNFTVVEEGNDFLIKLGMN